MAMLLVFWQPGMGYDTMKKPEQFLISQWLQVTSVVIRGS